METENTDDIKSQKSQSESSQDDSNINIVVAEIEEAVYRQFQETAFERYKQSVFIYASKVWQEARDVALQRDRNVNVQQFVTLVTGIIAKLAYDSAHVQTGDPGKDFLFWCIIFLFCIAITLTLNYFEMRSELLR
jgi:biopolymer transport protein ExbD